MSKRSVKWIRAVQKDIYITTGFNKKIVSAKVIKNLFAVHKTSYCPNFGKCTKLNNPKDRCHTITHIPSGGSIFRTPNETDAIKIAKELYVKFGEEFEKITKLPHEEFSIDFCKYMKSSIQNKKFILCELTWWVMLFPVFCFLNYNKLGHLEKDGFLFKKSFDLDKWLCYYVQR